MVNRRLLVGKEISLEDLPKILFETEVGKLMERMYALFGRRQRSEKEVKDYLRNLSFKRKIKDKEELSDVVIEAVIETLKRKGMVNDAQFAQSWVEARRKSKKKGLNALKSELYQKGIARNVIEETLEGQTSESEEKLAKEALEKKMRVWKNLEKLEFKKKALEFLVRRGFSYDVAKDVVDSFLIK